MSINKVLLIGNVGKDPDIRHLENGAVVASFSLATTERFKDKTGAVQDQTEWHNIVCWRNLAEIVEKYVTKGSQVYIEGKIRTRSWTDQTGQKDILQKLLQTIFNF
jgi:single stranded DNA-binding protein (ssb)